MAVSSQTTSQQNTTDWCPLLMEQSENPENRERIVDIERGCDASSSVPCGNDSLPNSEDRPSSGGAHVPITHSPSSLSNRSNSRNSSLTRRGEGLGRHNWSPFNAMLWLSIELVFTMGQIIAAIVVLYVARYEKPQTPLFAWVVGYAVGCTANLPIICFRYLYRNQVVEQRSSQLHQDASQFNSTPEPSSNYTISLAHSSGEQDRQNTSLGPLAGQTMGAPNVRFILLVGQFKMALDCFFAVWFVVGNVWIFGGHSSSSDAPNLYRICIVFLTITFIGYAMPFILCAMICCCLPCIISLLGVHDDLNQMRGANEETINALPTHKFKLRKIGSSSSRDGHSAVDEGGVIAAGTERERAISGEDAMCCICLASYADNDELRELPCSHFFHMECVDKWLKINASCPLCKFELGGGSGNSQSTTDTGQQV